MHHSIFFTFICSQPARSIETEDRGCILFCFKLGIVENRCHFQQVNSQFFSLKKTKKQIKAIMRSDQGHCRMLMPPQHTHAHAHIYKYIFFVYEFLCCTRDMAETWFRKRRCLANNPENSCLIPRTQKVARENNS